MSASPKQHAIRRSTRLPLEVPILVTSLDHAFEFSEECITTLVNAHGCGLVVQRSIPHDLPVRLEIVRSLSDLQERPCSAVEAKVAKSTLSHHFKVLREAGITHTRANGTHRLMSLRKDDLEDRFPGLLTSVLNATHVV